MLNFCAVILASERFVPLGTTFIWLVGVGGVVACVSRHWHCRGRRLTLDDTWYRTSAGNRD